MTRPETSTPESRARDRAKALSDLLWHVGAFVLVNAFLWIQDIAAGGGVEYAYWTTIPWSVGLLGHILAFTLRGDRYVQRRYEAYLAEEQERELQHH